MSLEYKGISFANLGISPGHGVLNVRDLYAPQLGIPKPTISSEISTFQSGHGWVIQNSTPGSIADDTSIFSMGSQSLQISTTGSQGVLSPTIVGKTGLTAIDFTSYDLRIRMRAETWSKIQGNGLRIRYGSDLTANYQERVFGPLESQIISGSANQYALFGGDGEWQDYTLNLGIPSTSAGNITLSAITAIAIYLTDNSNGSAVVHIQEVGLIPKSIGPYPHGVITFTFDDGYIEQWNNAKPKLDQYGYPATAFIIQDVIGSNAGTYMTVSQLQALEQQSGWEVACHSMFIADHNATNGFVGITNQQLDDNITQQKSWCMANGFKGKDFSAYPQGYYNDSVVQTMKRYFTAVRTTQGTDGFETFPPADPMKIRCVPLFDTTGTQSTQLAAYKVLIDNLYSQGGWINFYTHKVTSSPSGIQVTTTTFNALIDYIAAYGGISVRTFGDVIRAGSQILNSVSNTNFAKRAGLWFPLDNGWKVTPFDPVIAGAAVTLSTGVARGIRAYGTPGDTCTKLEFNQSAAGTSVSSSFYGIYNSSGTQLATGTLTLTGSGAQSATISSVTVPADGILIILVGASFTGTAPAFTGINPGTTLVSFAYPGSTRNTRNFTTGAALSAAPGSLSMQSLTANGNMPFFALR